MKIAICGSLTFTKEFDELRTSLEKLGHQVSLPITSQKILDGKVSLEDIEKMKQSGMFFDWALKHDSIRTYRKVISASDAILVANFDKNNVKNHIGGNSFLEMGFAHVLNKKIFLLHDMPEVSYIDEIKAMQPVILHGDFSKVK